MRELGPRGTTHRPSTTAMRALAMFPNTASGLSPSTTGFFPWWTYISHNIPGVGTALANVNTGNSLILVNDVDVHEAGVDLGLTRVCNSLSQHDANGTDGTTPSVWGNGWTSNLDAHLYNPTGTDISVYDGTGARFDYQCPTIGTSGVCTPLTAGDHNTLNLDPNNPCNYSWTLKSGVVYGAGSLGCAKCPVDYALHL